ncbi:baseplate multidomain protein megatron [Loktanella sp. Alg231-35]|uniref:baseplate multidomain protein megatron n=1 Tax=Loktanella sp. Alg231-35 TaxID=1922220 RepID=UPI000D556869|nr:glycoside hydrolase TIM-barrel-like domain-containing protein [Loktanella sp. Alg231-35]
MTEEYETGRNPRALANARLAEFEELFSEIRALIQQMKQASGASIEAPEQIIKKMDQLTKAHLTVLAAEDAFHAKYGYRDDAGAIHDLPYLQGNVAGGEGYDWRYPSPEARAAQRRVPITDSAGEPWIWRPKDLQNWWANPHHARIDGVRQATPTDRVPQSKPFWFTEMGCPAVDKGANQPHRQLNSAVEAKLPDGSSGARDDLMQMQYLRAITAHFADEAHNPPAAVAGGRMVDLDRMHVWGWDARPYPFWPGNQALWSDGDRYARGAWLNGRASNRSLASVVAEICDRSGVSRYDTSALFGIVRGYLVSDIGTGRAALQPLMLAYGFDAIERDGVLVFRNRSGAADHVLTDAMLALDPETDQALSLTRAAGAEVAGRVQMAFLHADGDYDAIAAETVLPDEVTLGITRNEAPLVLTRTEGQATVERWLQEARIGRDTARFALPPTQLDVGAGDVVRLATQAHLGTYRVDRIEEAGVRLVDATRVEPTAYAPPVALDEAVKLQPFVGPIPAELLFLDLPLLTGDEQPHAPYVAAAGRPWPGSIALYGAPQDSDYTVQEIINEAAVLGVTQSALARGPVGIWDRQQALQVKLVDGNLSSATSEALLAGANLMAIGNGSTDEWEVMQFQNAAPLFTRGFGLSGLLRGQAGSRGLMPDVWPIGSRVVLLNGVPEQITLPTASRGIARHFRFGPAKQPLTDPSYRYTSHAFAGNGLRPYPVAHLRAQSTGAGLDLSWIRCSRIDGDIWADGDIPLGEDSEAYTVRVMQGNAVRREVVVNNPDWSYTNAQIAADVGGASYDIAVAQMSARFGAGPFTTLNVTQ